MNSIQYLPFEIICAYIFIIGACVGSFLNVAILRGLSGENMVFERSKCPKCKKQLKWYMNIPLFSYIFLKGRCAYCREHISFQYPLVELITAIAFTFSFITFGFCLKTLFICIILSLFILLAATDFKETVIIDYHAYILLAVALLYSFLNLGDINIIQALIGAAFGFLFFELSARAGVLITGCRTFGEGDSLIALGLGAIFGYKVLLIVILLSILIQGVCAIPLLVKKALEENKKQLAFSYLSVFFGVIFLILSRYFNLSQNTLYYSIFVLILSVILLTALKNIISEIRDKKESTLTNDESASKFCLMPFGPALIFSSVLCIFYLEHIKNFIITH